MNPQALTRRQLLRVSLLGLPAITVAVGSAFAQSTPATQPAAPAAGAALPLLNPADPTAKALGYVEDAAKVDAKANPNYKPGQICGNCLQWADKNRKAPTGKCNLFPGKAVKNGGWCKVWVQGPA